MASSFATRLRRRDRPSPNAMTLTEHIAELRRRVVVALAAYAIASAVAFVGYFQILHWLQAPYCAVQHPCAFYVTTPLQGLSLRVKISAYGGLLLASPVIAWELWRFITPGLYRTEKRYAIPFVAGSVTLFGAGATLGYVAFPHALTFLRNVGGTHELHSIYSPNAYLSLILAIMAIFGASFEFPLILVALQLAGAVSPETLSSWRRWVIVAIVAGAAIFTPSGDPFSMFALAVPLYCFYEVSIVVGKLARRSRGRHPGDERQGPEPVADPSTTPADP